MLFLPWNMFCTFTSVWTGSSVGIATDYGLDGPGSNPGGDEIFRRPDRPWGPPSLLYNGYRVFPGGKVRPGRAADHSSSSSAAVIEEYSYTSTHSLGHTGPVTGTLYLYISTFRNMCAVLNVVVFCSSWLLLLLLLQLCSLPKVCAFEPESLINTHRNKLLY